MSLKILFEDNDIIAVEKLQGIPVQSDKTLDESIATQVENYLISKSNVKETNVNLINRIDRPVGGVVIFAKNKLAAKELENQISNHIIEKYYYAIVCGRIHEESGIVENYIKKLKTINMSKIVDATDKNGKKAKLEYKVLQSIKTEEYGELTLLKIRLYTGRHHQIRLQMSNLGYPIWGDNKYNRVFMKKKEFTFTALWACEYKFNHPRSKKRLSVKSEPFRVVPFNCFDKRFYI